MINKKSGHILVVDDHENWRLLLGAILEEEGYRVSTASSYGEATAMLGDIDFDIVILDMRLVDAESYNVQGMALLKLAKEKSSSTSAIILTGYPDPNHREMALGVYHADAYIEKVPPGKEFGVDGLVELVRHLME